MHEQSEKFNEERETTGEKNPEISEFKNTMTDELNRELQEQTQSCRRISDLEHRMFEIPQ